VQELDADLAAFGGAGPTLDALIVSWQQDYTTHGYGNASNPSYPFKPADFQAVNVGQLKYIANLFYSRLVQVGYTSALPAWLVRNPSTDNLAATAGQLKTVFNFDVMRDTDGNGLPDWWERHFFGNIGVNPNADPDGDGQTNLQEFLAGADPTKPPPPVLTIKLGDGQTGGAGGYVPTALTVQLSAAGQPVANGSVTFTVTQGGGQVQATTASAPAGALTVAANSSGIARVFFKLPNTNSTVCKVTAAAGAGATQTSVLFTETAGDTTFLVQTAACSISNMTGTLNADGSQDLTWVNNTDDPTIIYARESDGSWTPLETVPAGQTSCHLAPPQ
jgi:hypothetical protein